MAHPEQLSLFPTPGRPAKTATPAPIAAPPELGRDASLGAASGAFVTHLLRQGFSPHTVKAFRSDLNLLGQRVGAGTQVRRLRTRQLEDFLHWLTHERATACNAKSLARRVTTLKVFFKWLADTGILNEDPAAALVHQPVPSRLPDILYDDQVEALLAQARALRNATEQADARPYLLLTLVLTTGIKKSECMGVALDHLDLNAAGGPTVYIRYPGARNAHKERKLRLPADFPTVYQAYRAQYQPRERLFECTPRNLEYVLTDLAQRAGIAEISFEMLRMTAAVRDYRDGMPPDTLRQKLGLSTITWADTGDKVRRLAEPAL